MQKRILEIINTIYREKTGKNLKELDPQMHLKNDLGFDSLDFGELAARIETEYDIDVFEEGVANNIHTLNDILEKLKDR